MQSAAQHEKHIPRKGGREQGNSEDKRPGMWGPSVLQGEEKKR